MVSPVVGQNRGWFYVSDIHPRPGKGLTMKLSLVLVIVMISFDCCFAQNTDWAKSPNPRILSISTEVIRLGQEDAHQKTESGWRRAFNKANFPSYFVGLASLTGPSTMVFLTGYDSLAGMQKEDEAQSANAWLWAEQDKLSIEDSAFLTSKNHEYAELQLDLSVLPKFSLGAARSFSISRIEVDPSHQAEFKAWLKSQVGLGLQHLATYEIIAGGLTNTYVLIEARTSLAEFDKNAVNLSTSAPGARSIIRNYFTPDPSTSRVTPEFAKGNEKFWNPTD
jgi:hypothetical protein